MISSGKMEFLVKQGYSQDVINFFINCGAEKHLLWFLTLHKKKHIQNLNAEEIKVVNKYLEECKEALKSLSSINDKSKIYTEALKRAYEYKKDLERKEKNIIHRFENGYYISILNEQDLYLEGRVMSNCVGGYHDSVKNKEVGLLALKHPSEKTVVHIEIKKNGQISQNFSKANSTIGNECWKMILEFFEKNSKKVDFKNIFGDAYITSSGGGYINSVSLCAPLSITHTLEDGQKKISFNDAFELKRFSLDIPRESEELKFLNKSDLLKWLEGQKNKITKIYNDLIEQVDLTNSSNLYLSDEIKRKIFGNHKNAFLMKGEKYNISEINIYQSPLNQDVAYENDDVEEVMNDVQEDVQARVVEERVVREINEVARILPRIVGQNELNTAPAPHRMNEIYGNVEFEGDDLPFFENEMEPCKEEERAENTGNQPHTEEQEPVPNMGIENIPPNGVQFYEIVNGAEIHYEDLNVDEIPMAVEMPPTPFEEILRRAK